MAMGEPDCASFFKTLKNDLGSVRTVY